MILAEPPPSQGDLHFRIGPFPVRIHPFFWLVALVTGMRIEDPKLVLMWMVVVLVSLVVHELGHAVLQRAYGGNPRIVLHGFGGLAISNVDDRSARTSILISLAGPAAGFLFAGVLIAGMGIAGAQMQFVPAWSTGEELSGFPVGLGVGTLGIEGIAGPLGVLLYFLLQVNVLWGLINLLPIYPLDGGQVSRELLTLVYPPRVGIIRSLWLSIACAAAAAVMFGLLRQSLFNALLFGYLAYSSYQTLQAYHDQGRYQQWR